MKRILHIIGGMDRAGAETMVMNLYRKINKEEYQFDFLYFTDRKCDYDDEIIGLGGRIFRIYNYKNPIDRTFNLYKLIKKEAPFHAVHCHMLFSNSLHILAGYFAGIKTRISHSHNTSDVNSKSFIGKIYQKISRLIIAEFSTHFIACGEKAGKFLFPNQKEVLFLPNAIDTNYFLQIGTTDKNYINNKFSIPNHCLKIIQIGRLQPVKNHLFSIKIAKELKHKGINFKLFFVGDGDLFGLIKETILKENLNNEVLLLGVRSDIPQLMAGADALLMPSLHEGFPVVLVESQSVGLPSLIADTISPEVDLEVNLIEFESLDSNVTDWIEKLVSLKIKEKINNQLRLQKLADQGFDINSSAKLLTNFYSSMN